MSEGESRSSTKKRVVHVYVCSHVSIPNITTAQINLTLGLTLIVSVKIQIETNEILVCKCYLTLLFHPKSLQITKT